MKRTTPIHRIVRTRIDRARCTGCGRCVRICPADTLALIDGRAAVVGDHSLQCDQCAAVCPEGAVAVGGADERQAATRTIDDSGPWIAPGDYDSGSLVRLMRSRRSCRNFDEARAVPRELLEDLVRIGQSAPSGTNSRRWFFSAVEGRERVLRLGEGVARFFERLNRLASWAPLREGARLVGRPELARYHRDHFETVSEGLRQWRHEGRDRLFHGATAVLLVGSGAGASCPAEDALLATQNILLAAHAEGLGSCLVGFVVEAIRRDGDLRRQVDLAAGEEIHAVIALGYGGVSYARVTAARRVPTRWLDSI